MKFTINSTEDKINDLNDDIKKQGEKFSLRITKAMKKESWKWVALELAWTAGITVIIGLYVAYHIGYGKSPDSTVIVYFATYSAIAAIMAVVVKMIRHAASVHEAKDNQRTFLRCNNHIFYLMHLSRNMSMEGMEGMQRRIFSAYIILKDPEATSSDLYVAVFDLTGDEELAKSIQRIETYRQHSLYARIEDEYAKVKSILTDHLENLRDIAPKTTQLLENRFKGFAPSMQAGQERPVGFLERTLNSIEHNDLNIMAFDDAYEIFRLAFELLNDREILSIHPEFKGHDDYVTAQEKLDRSRAYLKMSIAKRNSRLKAIAEMLMNISGTDAIAPTTFNSEEIVQLVDNEFKAVKKIIDQRIKDGDKEDLKEAYKTLRQCFKFLEKVDRYQNRAERYLRVYASMQKTYEKAWRKHGKHITHIIEDNSNKDGITIREETIHLDDAQKMVVAHKITTLHDHTRVEHKKPYQRFTAIEFTPHMLKRLAMEYTLILDEVLNFSQPEEMQAIEYSQAAAFDHIDINTPTRTKVGLALISIEELQQMRQKVAHRLAKNLREYYKVPLNKNIINYLVKNFGADRELLFELNQNPLTEKQKMEEKYNVFIKVKDWEKRLAPTVKKLKEELKPVNKINPTTVRKLSIKKASK